MLQEIAKILINPLLYIWLGILVVLFIKRRNLKLIITINIFFYFATIPFTSYVFNRIWSVEDTFNPFSHYDAAIVLMGVTDHKWYIENKNKFPDIENYYRFNLNADRVLKGVSLVKSARADVLLIGELIIGDFNETVVVKKFALSNGLREDQINIYGKIERTLDEAINIKAFVIENSIQKILLITSASHMRRARAMFKQQGLMPETYSVNRGGRNITWEYFIPSPEGADYAMVCLYELVGYFGYYFRGDL